MTYRKAGYPPEGLQVTNTPPGYGAMRANARGALGSALLARREFTQHGRAYVELTYGSGRQVIIPAEAA